MPTNEPRSTTLDTRCVCGALYKRNENVEGSRLQQCRVRVLWNGVGHVVQLPVPSLPAQEASTGRGLIARTPYLHLCLLLAAILLRRREWLSHAPAPNQPAIAQE